MFEPTIPFGDPELMRVSEFRRYLDDLTTSSGGYAPSSLLSSLGPSLMADLQRFEQEGGVTEALEVLAACVRHSQRVTVHVQSGDKVVPLTIFPHERLVHSPLRVDDLLASRLTDLVVLHVEPATLRPPGDSEASLVGENHLYAPLGPLLWDLAMRGTRDSLLPEISGNAAYRLAPGADLRALRLSGSLQAGVDRLRRGSANLKEIASWPGFDRERAQRMLNGLYLQAGLIVSRTLPEASGESWFGGLI